MTSTPNTSNIPGRGYSPGSKCLVSCPADPLAELKTGITLSINPELLAPAKDVATALYGDNGRIVKLLGIVGNNYPICGGSSGVRPGDPICWHVEPADNLNKFRSVAGIHTNHTAIFFQYQLIPLGDDDLTVEVAAETATGDATDLHVALEGEPEQQLVEEKGVDKGRGKC